MDAVTRFLDRRDVLLPRLDEQLQQATTPTEVAWVLCEFTGRELNLADCVVYLPADGDVLLQTAAWGSLRGIEHLPESRLRVPVGQGIAGHCARTLKIQLIGATRNDPHFVEGDELCVSELAVPIEHDEVLLGILDSESPEENFYDARYEAAFAAIAASGAGRLWWLQGQRAKVR
ncbi:GAF domain-containing protein [Lysobacter terrae]